MYTLQKAIIHGGSLKAYKRKRRVTKRFYLILGTLIIMVVVILALIYTPLLDKLSELISQPKATSPYWQAVFGI